MTTTSLSTATSRTVEHRGVSIDAAECAGTVYVAIDGVESHRQFASLAHAIDFGKRAVDRRARAASRPEPVADRCLIPSHQPWALAWDAEHGWPEPRDYAACSGTHTSQVFL